MKFALNYSRASAAALKATERSPRSAGEPQINAMRTAESRIEIEATRRKCIRNYCQCLSIITGMLGHCLVNSAL